MTKEYMIWEGSKVQHEKLPLFRTKNKSEKTEGLIEQRGKMSPCDGGCSSGVDVQQGEGGAKRRKNRTRRRGSPCFHNPESREKTTRTTGIQSPDSGRVHVHGVYVQGIKVGSTRLKRPGQARVRGFLACFFCRETRGPEEINEAYKRLCRINLCVNLTPAHAVGAGVPFYMRATWCGQHTVTRPRAGSSATLQPCD